MKSALLIIDLQNDFCPGGALEVPRGDEVVPVINRLLRADIPVIQTQDWHPPGHLSFASSHEGKDPFDTIELDYGEQVLWPDHCVQGTAGADFHPDLDRQRAEMIVRKGFRPSIDSYSAFRENDGETSTGLAGYLREREIGHVVLAGLATDFCVRWSAEDARSESFAVTVIEDAVRGIDMDGSLEKAWQAMRDAGVRVMTADSWLESR
jgi:nicotinamidase/pyrazinamidase